MIKSDGTGCIEYCPGIQATNAPSYKYAPAAINYCVADCFTKDNTYTINTAGTECTLISGCAVLSKDSKNCLTECPAG